MLIKPVVKTGRREVKSPVSLTRDLGVSFKVRRRRWMGVRLWGWCWCRVFIVCRFVHWRPRRWEWVRYQKCLKWAHIDLRTAGKGPFCVTGVRNDRQLFTVATKCCEKLCLVELINKTCCLMWFWPCIVVNMWK